MGEIDLEKLREFIFEAHQHGYAGDGEKCQYSQRPDFEEYSYQAGEWYYRDSFCGHYLAPGQEVVYFKKPVWAMSYAGGMKPEYHGDYDLGESTAAFLKEALFAADKDKPFRGPKIYEKGDWLYINHLHGNITDFLGNEKIYKGHKLLFEQNYIGGLII